MKHLPQLVTHTGYMLMALLLGMSNMAAGTTAANPSQAVEAFNPQQVINQGIKNFITSQGKNIIFFIDGKQRGYDNLKSNMIHKGHGVLFDGNSKKTYRYFIDENSSDTYFPLTLLENSPNNAYWFSFYSEKVGNYFIFIEQGEFIKPEKETFILAGSKQYVKTTNGYYVVESYRKAKPNNFYPAKAVKSSDFFAAKSANDDLFNTNLVTGKAAKAPTPVAATQQTKAAATQQTKAAAPTNNNFGCYKNQQCLVNYFNSRINKLTAQGKSLAEAKKIFGEEFEAVFKADPKLAYEAIMKADQKVMLDAMGNVSSSTRSQLRALAMGEVKAYEKKYGTREVKTVPYRPK